ncbi:hypothetical protein K438DRAFT_1769054 [Mycena galopus ATCC 62051]|nr:hypothetical protein K438DRAFT_1769054 [Mycena galopus ATCC 62051]
MCLWQARGRRHTRANKRVAWTRQRRWRGAYGWAGGWNHVGGNQEDPAFPFNGEDRDGSEEARPIVAGDSEYEDKREVRGVLKKQMKSTKMKLRHHYWQLPQTSFAVLEMPHDRTCMISNDVKLLQILYARISAFRRQKKRPVPRPWFDGPPPRKMTNGTGTARVPWIRGHGHGRQPHYAIKTSGPVSQLDTPRSPAWGRAFHRTMTRKRYLSAMLIAISFFSYQ